MLARLRVGLGDSPYLTERPEGFTVTASSPDFEKRMALAEQIMRDAGLLESALARPINRWGCGDDDPATLAAAYAYGIARTRELLAIGK